MMAGLGGCGKQEKASQNNQTNETSQKQQAVGEKNAKGLVKMLKAHPAKIAMGTNANRDTVVVVDGSIGYDGKVHAFDDESKGISSYLYCRNHGMINAQEEALRYFFSVMKDEEGKKLYEMWRDVNPDKPLLVPADAVTEYLTISDPKVKVIDNQAYFTATATVHYHMGDGVEKTKKFFGKYEVEGSTEALSDESMKFLEGEDVVYNEPLIYGNENTNV